MYLYSIYQTGKATIYNPHENGNKKLVQPILIYNSHRPYLDFMLLAC